MQHFPFPPTLPYTPRKAPVPKPAIKTRPISVFPIPAQRQAFVSSSPNQSLVRGLLCGGIVVAFLGSKIPFPWPRDSLTENPSCWFCDLDRTSQCLCSPSGSEPHWYPTHQFHPQQIHLPALQPLSPPAITGNW